MLFCWLMFLRPFAQHANHTMTWIYVTSIQHPRTVLACSLKNEAKLLIEDGICGGVATISYCYEKANVPGEEDYDSKIPN